MAIAGSIFRMVQAGYYALTEEDGLGSSKCSEALDKADKALKRPPLFETVDIISDLFD